MSKHIGTIGTRISVEVQLVNDYSYEDTKFSYYGTTHYIYTMQDNDGNVYVWKTTNTLIVDNPDKTNGAELYAIRKGDTMQIVGTVKEHTEYKGTKQTVLTRCKFSLVKQKLNEKNVKAEQQKQSIGENDFVWEMPYKQFKEHYADCETLVNSYNAESRTIKVIIRQGRLRKSGVRGKHFNGYAFTDGNGNVVCYRAVSEAHARKHMKKDFPDSDNWEFFTVY